MKNFLLVAMLAVASLVGCSSEVQIDGRSVPEWIGLFRHEDWNTRLRAQDILSRLGTPALPYLKRALRSEDPAIRMGAVATLRKMGNRGQAALGDLLGQLSREQADSIRAEILRALLAIDAQNEKVQETFRKRLADQSEQVRAAAQAGLDFSRPTPALPLEKAPAEPQAQFELRQQLEKLFPDSAAALLAEVQRENLRAVIFWPFEEKDRLQQEKVWGQLFRREGESWTAEGKPFELTGAQGASVLAQALQGSDKQRVFRSCGVKKEELAAHLASGSERFYAAWQQKDYRRAAQEVEQLALAFDFRTLAFRDTLPRLLAEKAFGPPEWKIEFLPEGGARAELAGEKGAVYRLTLSACADGQVISAIEPASPTGQNPAGDNK